MAVIDGGSSTAGKANTSANFELEVHTNDDPTKVGYTRIAGRDGEAMGITRTGYVRSSVETLEFFDTIDGTAVNTNLWNQSTATMTITQSAGFINLNPTNSVAASVHAILSTIQQFFNTSTLPLYVRMSIQASLLSAQPVNTVTEFGWMTCATTAAPTDGVFVRFLAGQAYLVLNNGGSEFVTQFTIPPTVNNTYDFFFNIYGTACKLYIDNVLVLDVSSPGTQAAITNSNRQPIGLRVYNTASAPSASSTLRLGQISVANINANFSKPLARTLIGMGRSCVQNPVTTFTQLANYANSAAPTSATLSNTAAGYTTLGGQFQFAAVAGAETDYALFGYQVPTGYQLIVSGVRIATYNMVVAIATTPTVFQWSLGVNSSAVSLATADGAGTWKPRIRTIGSQSMPVASPVGFCATDVIWTAPSESPVCIEGGRFFHVILKMPVGTATATEIFRGTVGIDGWFE